MRVLEYTEWRKFENVIKKAICACESGLNNNFEHFVGAAKMLTVGNNIKNGNKGLSFV